MVHIHFHAFKYLHTHGCVCVFKVCANKHIKGEREIERNRERETVRGAINRREEEVAVEEENTAKRMSAQSALGEGWGLRWMDGWGWGVLNSVS
jgi:hypothetical protein